MPHQFMAITCKKCGEFYCPACHKECPKCGEIDTVDEKTMGIRKQMQQHMRRKVKDDKINIKK